MTYTRGLLKSLCGQAAVDELDNHLSSIPRFPGLKIFKHSLENIKQFTADEFRNMMKVFLFVIERIIIKHHKTSIRTNIVKQYDNTLVDVYYSWNKMYLCSWRDQFLNADLEEFDV